MLLLHEQLSLERCPHCYVDKPSLVKQWGKVTQDYTKSHVRHWVIYECARCGGLVSAASPQGANNRVSETYPIRRKVVNSLPNRAKDYLTQAYNSLHSPAGAIMLAASSVDDMLKNIGYKEGKLYPRINQAEQDHKITSEMAKWAHQVRLDANAQRHDDEDSPMPSTSDAKQSVEFASALGEFLFELPSRISEGLKESRPEDDEGEKDEADEPETNSKKA